MPVATMGDDGTGTRPLSYLHTDHLGRPAFATDTSGATIWDGGIRTPFGIQVASLGAAAQKLMFPGQYADEETGYSDNWHRTYDPTLGRYLQSDPIGLVGGLNRYAYVGGNPITRVDPDGLITVYLTFTIDIYIGVGFSLDTGFYYSDEGECGAIVGGVFGAAKLGVGLDVSAGLSAGLGSGSPNDLYDGLYAEGELSVLATNIGFSQAVEAEAGSVAIGVEVGTPVGINAGVGVSGHRQLFTLGE